MYSRPEIDTRNMETTNNCYGADAMNSQRLLKNNIDDDRVVKTISCQDNLLTMGLLQDSRIVRKKSFRAKNTLFQEINDKMLTKMHGEGSVMSGRSNISHVQKAKNNSDGVDRSSDSMSNLEEEEKKATEPQVNLLSSNMSNIMSQDNNIFNKSQVDKSDIVPKNLDDSLSQVDGVEFRRDAKHIPKS